MEEKQPDDVESSESNRPSPRSAMQVILLLLLGLFVVMTFAYPYLQAQQYAKIDYSFFRDQVEAGNVQETSVGPTQARGVFKEPPEPPVRLDAQGDRIPPKRDSKGDVLKLKKLFIVDLPPYVNMDNKLVSFLEEHKVVVQAEPPSGDPTPSLLIMGMVLSIGLFVFVWFSMRRAQAQMMGGGFLTGFTRSPAKRYEASKQAITFKDVAGLEQVKAELIEIVEFLKSPEKFQRLGGRVPKGVLLNGPPGTGKTLLARAVAGEAGVPFFSVNGSEFIQMFVGVGASRVRDLFKQAKDASPAIIFVDEIDAVGRQRGAGLGGGHDEREQTLNQILSEMDGFAQNDFVIVMAATNRPDVLDPALLRPGRFDRQITVGRPTHKGRLEIFKVHVRNVPLADDVDLDVLASATIGLTGADIRNIVNEAALWAARHDKTSVSMADFEYARDKVLIGPKREEVLQEKEKEKTAYHEAGHTILGWILPGAHRVHKVTIVPRGRALGVTHTMPSEDRLGMAEGELRDLLTFMLGGRAAERIIYEETTVGAENDLERATGLARRMVMSWGMSAKIGPVSLKMSDDDPFLGRELHQQRQFSEHTMEVIDEEVTRILRETDQRAEKLLLEKREKLDALAQALLREEELDEKEIAAILGPSVHTSSNGKATHTPDGTPVAAP